MNKILEPILIVSPPRSGSSLLSYILSKEGLQCGLTKEGDEYNPNGYFENLQIRELVIKQLEQNDTNKLGKKYQPVNLDFTMQQAETFRNNVITCMKSQNVDISSPWMFKDPKIALVWKLFAKAFPNAKFILLYRNEKDILHSYERTKFMDAYTNMVDWQKYLGNFKDNMKSIENECANHHVFQIESIFDNDECAINQLFDFLELQNTKQYLSCVKKEYFQRS